MALRSGLQVWHGEAVADRVVKAAQAAIDETLAAALANAIPRAPIRTGFLRGTGFVIPAVRTPQGPVGRWGFSASYAAYQEFGTVNMSPRPFMRPAADAIYPTLPQRIRDHFKRGAG